MKKKRIIIIGVISIILIIIVVLMFLFFRKKYSDCTIELGTDSISVKDFSKYSMYNKKTKILTNLDKIDLSKVGIHDIVLEYLGKKETVKLKIEDTTAPKVEFKDLMLTPGSTIKAEDFIISMEDLQDMTVSIEADDVDTSVYKEYEIKVKVTDKSNNVTEKVCKLTINWLISNIELEVGDNEILEKVLVDPAKDKNKISKTELDKVKIYDVGTYVIKAISEGKEYPITIKVIDTTKPTLKLRDISMYLDSNTNTDKNAFIVSVNDNSKKVSTELKSKIDIKKIGKQTITIEATDPSGNKISKSATLTIKKDTIPPVITGLSDLVVNKRTNIDYLKGVTSVDNVDGKCTIEVDSSSVDVTKAGVYYAKYVSKDKKNNTTTKKRKITVNHDAEDTNDLARQFASSAPNDPLELSRHIRSKIKYASNWGENDPVWYALTKYRGNCYVHANLYIKIAQIKGYTVRLIHNLDNSHYWVMIYLNGVWRHVDPTPTNKDGLMTDAEMLTNKALKGVGWDTNAYPKAE